MHDVAVYIGRFQPFHKVHEHTLRFALKTAKRVILVVGSANTERSYKNPWTASERVNMIARLLQSDDLFRVSIVKMDDFPGDNEKWVAELSSLVARETGGATDVALIGHEKDDSSFYLKLFPHWAFLPTDMTGVPEELRNLSATKVRDALFLRMPATVHDFCADPIFQTLLSFQKTHPEYEKIRSAWWKERTERILGKKHTG